MVKIILLGEGCFCGIKCATEFANAGLGNRHQEKMSGSYYDEELGITVAYDEYGHLL